MDTMMLVQTVGQLAMMALTGIAGWLGGKIKTLKAQQEQKDAQAKLTQQMLKMLLFYRLRDLYTDYVTDGKPVSSAEKKDIEELYELYHDELGGNGEGTRMYNELMQLKVS